MGICRSGEALTPQALSEQIARWVEERVASILCRSFSGPVLPRFQAGHRLGPDTYADLMGVMRHLHALGVRTLADVAVEDWIRRLLPTVDGPATQTFGSLAIAEILLAWGPFEGNPLLEGLSVEQRDNIAAACDTSHIFRDDGTIGEWSANYWMVLARAEYARERLGLLRDTSILEAALTRCRLLLEAPIEEFFDDSATGVGRYDTYSMGVFSILCPLAHRLPEPLLRERLARDVRMLETLAMENGAFVAWGRSIGLLSLTATLGHAAAALRDGLGEDSGRLMALATHAAARIPDWFRDDLVAAHRDRMTFGYRGPQRLLQMTFDCLSSLAGCARVLRELPVVPPASLPLFPERDEVIHFDRDHAGGWMFRNAHMAFQLPFVSAWLGTDYVPWPHSPGLFENPVDCPMRFGVPVVLAGGRAFGPGERPAGMTKQPGALTLTYDSLLEEVAGGWMPDSGWRRMPAALTLAWRVEGARLCFEQRLILDAVPDGLVVSIPQAGRTLEVTVQDCSVPFSQNALVVDGIAAYRSFWSQLTAVHELHLQPAREIVLRFEVHVGPNAIRLIR